MAGTGAATPSPGSYNAVIKTHRQLRTLPAMSDVTQILSAIEQGDAQATEQLLPLVYEELRRLAAQKMAEEEPGQTLQATALVHEAYIRLVDVAKAQHWDSRGHFFAAAAEAMRRSLVENARKKGRIKHGGDRRRVYLFAILGAGTYNAGPSNATWLEGDFNNGDEVNSTNLFLMLSIGKYNQGPYSTTEATALEAVPEPSSIALATLSLIGLLAFASRRRAKIVGSPNRRFTSRRLPIRG